MIRLYILLLLSITSTVLFAQPANDDCNNAQTISLPSPASCPSGDGAAITVSGTTNNATPSNPYPYMTGCSTGGTQRSPALDVWYSFVATGTILNLSINASFATPNIGLWTGTCGALLGVDCAKGDASGNLNYSNTALTPGRTYYIQLSGNTATAEGDFSLTIDNDIDCNNCVTTASFTASPPPNEYTIPCNQLRLV